MFRSRLLGKGKGITAYFSSCHRDVEYFEINYLQNNTLKFNHFWRKCLVFYNGLCFRKNASVGFDYNHLRIFEEATTKWKKKKITFFRYIFMKKKLEIHPNLITEGNTLYSFLYNMINFNCCFLLFCGRIKCCFIIYLSHSTNARNALNFAVRFIKLHYYTVTVNSSYHTENGQEASRQYFNKKETLFSMENVL